MYYALSRHYRYRCGYNDQQKPRSVTLLKRIPQFEAGFSPDSIDSLCLQVAQVPRSQLQDCCVTIATVTTIRPITLPLARVRKVIT